MEETKASVLSLLRRGARDGVPIGLGYFAVAFALGIQAKVVGLSPVQGFFMSILGHASAGEYAALKVMAAQSGLVVMAVMTLVANARYLLMSAAMSQRMDPKGSLLHRLAMSFLITDELFAITIARPGYLDPVYLYGAALVACPSWAMGTALGCMAGNVMPARAVSALSVALFGMFLAIIIPPARREKVIAALVVLCFAASFAFSRLPVVSTLSEGTRTILLTVVIASGAAILFPHPQESRREGEDQ